MKSKYKLKTPKRAEAVADACRKAEYAIEGAYKRAVDTVLSAYKSVEDTVVGSRKAVEKRLVDPFLETIDGDDRGGEAPSV